jgi:hypothetical protein
MQTNVPVALPFTELPLMVTYVPGEPPLQLTDNPWLRLMVEAVLWLVQLRSGLGKLTVVMKAPT